MTSSLLGSPCARADDDSVAELSYSGDVGAARHRIQRCISMHGLSRSCAGAGLALDERNAEVEIRGVRSGALRDSPSGQGDRRGARLRAYLHTGAPSLAVASTGLTVFTPMPQLKFEICVCVTVADQ